MFVEEASKMRLANGGYRKMKKKDFLEFWRQCNFQCPNYKMGCAVNCEKRKRLHTHIPPFGDKYTFGEKQK